MGALGVRRVRRDNRCAQVKAVQQRGEPGDLVGLARHVQPSEHNPGVVIDHGQQMPGLAIGAAGTTHGLAIHRDEPPPGAGHAACCSGRGTAVSNPAADHPVEAIAVDRLHDPADRGLTWPTRTDTNPGGGLGGQVLDPLGDRDERPRPGQHRADRHGQHRDQAMPDTTASPRIHHHAQHLTQPDSGHDRIGYVHTAQRCPDQLCTGIWTRPVSVGGHEPLRPRRRQRRKCLVQASAVAPAIPASAAPR